MNCYDVSEAMHFLSKINALVQASSKRALPSLEYTTFQMRYFVVQLNQRWFLLATEAIPISHVFEHSFWRISVLDAHNDNLRC